MLIITPDTTSGPFNLRGVFSKPVLSSQSPVCPHFLGRLLKDSCSDSALANTKVVPGRFCGVPTSQMRSCADWGAGRNPHFASSLDLSNGRMKEGAAARLEAKTETSKNHL